MSFDKKKITGASSDDQGSGTNPWLCLSDEMALYVLRHLPQKSLVTVSLVNKKFRDLSRDDSLWTELTLDYKDIKHSADSCRKLVERCKKLASLKISNKSCGWNTLDIMTVVILAKESLKSLEVDTRMDMDIWTTAANTKLGRLTNLTSLTLAINMYAKNRQNWGEDLANLQKLEVLDLQMTGYRDSLSVMKTLKSVFGKLKKLKKVKIDFDSIDLFELDDNHFEDRVVDESCFVGALATNNPDLTVLCLMNYPSLSDETLVLLANSSLGLEEFKYCGYLGVNVAVTDRGIERMVGATKNLKRLHLILGRAPRVTKDLVKRMWEEHQYLLVTLS